MVVIGTLYYSKFSLKNEVELKQMAEIFDKLNLYVPMCHYCSTEEDGEVEYHVAPIPCLLFGDQLTVACV